jgi:hypothetical protein
MCHGAHRCGLTAGASSATIVGMMRRPMMTRARPERVWASLMLTAFSARMTSSAAKELGALPALGVVWLVVAAVLFVLLVGEVRAQAHHAAAGGAGWTGHARAILAILGCYAVLASSAAAFGHAPVYERVAAAVVAPVYLLLCVYFVLLRRRTPGSAKPRIAATWRTPESPSTSTAGDRVQ